MTTTIRASIRREYGGTEVVHVADVPAPTITDEQVLVDVHAAGVDRGVWHLMVGEPLVVRPVFGVRRPRQPILGTDVAGVVRAVGSKVTTLKVGDEVYGGCNGSFAEQVAAKPSSLALKPASLTFEEAATIPVSALTALQALRDRTRVQPGQRVLVVGASGGVGVYAVQIAVAMGAEVTAVCSGAKGEAVRALGAHHVLDYTRQAIGDLGRHDVILDINGRRSIGELRGALTERGTASLIGAEGGGRWFGMGRQLRAVALSPFVRQRLGMMIATTNSADLDELRQMVDDGRLRPVVHAAYPLEGVPAAIDDMVQGRVTGKTAIVLR